MSTVPTVYPLRIACVFLFGAFAGACVRPSGPRLVPDEPMSSRDDDRCGHFWWQEPLLVDEDVSAVSVCDTRTGCLWTRRAGEFTYEQRLRLEALVLVPNRRSAGRLSTTACRITIAYPDGLVCHYLAAPGDSLADGPASLIGWESLVSVLQVVVEE